MTKCQSFDRYVIKVTDCKHLNSATSWRFHSHIVLVWLGFGRVMVFRAISVVVSNRSIIYVMCIDWISQQKTVYNVKTNVFGCFRAMQVYTLVTACMRLFKCMRLFNYIERFWCILHLVDFFAWKSIYCIDRNSQIYKFCDVEQFMLFLQYESVESECFLKKLYIYSREHIRPVQRRVAPMLRLNGQTITI